MTDEQGRGREGTDWFCQPNSYASAWVVCPECGSGDAHLDYYNYEYQYHCPDCGETLFVAGG